MKTCFEIWKEKKKLREKIRKGRENPSSRFYGMKEFEVFPKKFLSLLNANESILMHVKILYS